MAYYSASDEEDEYKPIGTRIKIEGTIDSAVYDAVHKVLEKEKQKAENEDKRTPNLSEILEMLLRKGLKAYNAQIQAATK